MKGIHDLPVRSDESVIAHKFSWRVGGNDVLGNNVDDLASSDFRNGIASGNVPRRGLPNPLTQSN